MQRKTVTKFQTPHFVTANNQHRVISEANHI